MSVVRVQILAEAQDRGPSQRFGALLPKGDQLEPPTLENIRKKYGEALEVELEDRFGIRQSFSLQAFAGMSPDTYISVMFISGPVEKEFPPIPPGAVLLKEYLVAEPPEAGD